MASVLAPYGIDPFAMLAMVQKEAPFTMGTASPDKWAAYEGQLAATAHTNAAAEKLQRDNANEIELQKKAQEILGNGGDTGSQLEDLSKAAAGYGNFNPLIAEENAKESRLYRQSLTDSRAQKENMTWLNDALKLAEKNPQAARGYVQGLIANGVAPPGSDNLISDDMKKPDKTPVPKASKFVRDSQGQLHILDPVTGQDQGIVPGDFNTPKKTGTKLDAIAHALDSSGVNDTPKSGPGFWSGVGDLLRGAQPNKTVIVRPKAISQ